MPLTDEILGNPNLMRVLCPVVDKGNERETFFFGQLKVIHEVTYPKSGDFLILFPGSGA